MKETKTETARRQVSLDAVAIEMLRRQKKRVAEWQLAAGASWQNRGLIFPKHDGAHRHVESARWKIERIAEKAGLPVLTFHDLRHLSGSLLLALGADLKMIQWRLGHSSIDVTADIYLHVLPGRDAEVADRLGQRLTDMI